MLDGAVKERLAYKRKRRRNRSAGAFRLPSFVFRAYQLILATSWTTRLVFVPVNVVTS